MKRLENNQISGDTDKRCNNVALSPDNSKSSLTRLSSLDERIAALEKSMLQDSDDIESDASLSSDESINPDFKIHKEIDRDGNVTRLISLVDAKIPPLPVHLLPAKNISSNPYSNPNRKVKFNCDDGCQNEHNVEKRSRQIQQDNRRSGMERTVQDLLKNYIPSSIEKRPNYCRVCQYQATNLEELEKHRLSQIHAEACRKEKAISYCKLCRKQLTSPDQMKNHLKGKAHNDRLQQLRSHSGKKFES